MSFEPDNIDSELTVADLLKEILAQLVLLNMRYEEATNTGIQDEDAM